MHSRRSRSFRGITSRRLPLLVIGLSLLGACSGGISGSAVLPSVAVPAGGVGSSAAPSSTAPGSGGGDGQITVPSGGPASAPATSSAVPTSGPGTAQPQVTGTVTPPGPVPAGLARYYGQKVTWGACAPYATSAADATTYASDLLQCTRLVVPLSYADPNGKTITVGLLRKQSTDQSGRIGSVLMDPGGPGASGMSFVATLALPTRSATGTTSSPAVAAELNKKFDLVGFDPRGVGSSTPVVQCQTDAERDAQRAVVPRSRNQADVDAANAVLKKIVALCVSRVGAAQGIDGAAFLANVGTRDVVKDLDVMRAALGDAKLTYTGFSYGTQIGWTYAEQFPANVRGMVLDGMVSPDQDPATNAIAQAAAFQSAFNDFAAWCATSSPGCILGTDPTKATAVYQSLVRPLLDRPLTLPGGRELSFSDAITGTSAALYSDSLRTTLAAALTRAAAGDGRVLMALADSYYERDQTGHYGNLLQAFDAVRCVDAPRLTDPPDITKFNAAQAKVAPFEFTGDPPGAVADICAYWPVPATGTPHKLKAPGLPKVLIISTTGDPATPYQNGVEVAQQINSVLLTVKGTRHTAYLGQGLGCVDAIGNAYLENLTLPATGTTCS